MTEHRFIEKLERRIENSENAYLLENYVYVEEFVKRCIIITTIQMIICDLKSIMNSLRQPDKSMTALSYYRV